MKQLGPPEIGTRFNRLVVVQHVGKNWDNADIVKCLCDCGNETVVLFSSIKCGNTKSCGCLQREWASNRAKHYNVRHHLERGEAAFRKIYRQYKYQAANRGLPFLLTENEARELFTSNCFYCGTPPSNLSQAGYGNMLYNGIDRKNNSIGYTAENCVSSCPLCNHAKNDMAFSDFVSWIHRCHANISKAAQRIKQNPDDLDLAVDTPEPKTDISPTPTKQ